MPRAPEPKSFEVKGTRYETADDLRSLLMTAAHNHVPADPTIGLNISMSGEHLVVKFHCYDRSLDDPRRREGILSAAEKAIKDYVSYLKKEVRTNGGGSPKLKELKDRRDYAFNKVSLNDRWYLQCIRVFEVDDLTDYPEED